MKYLALSVAMICITVIIIVLLAVCKVDPGELLATSLLVFIAMSCLYS